MNFAVAQISGKQYLLNENQTLLVDKLNYSEGESFVIDQVLLVNADDEVKIGTPFVENAKIQVKVIAQEKGPKIRVAKFKAKSRYRRVMGFRSRLTKIQIISLSGEKPVKESLPAGPLRRIEASRQGSMFHACLPARFASLAESRRAESRRVGSFYVILKP